MIGVWLRARLCIRTSLSPPAYSSPVRSPCGKQRRHRQCRQNGCLGRMAQVTPRHSLVVGVVQQLVVEVKDVVPDETETGGGSRVL